MADFIKTMLYLLKNLEKYCNVRLCEAVIVCCIGKTSLTYVRDLFIPTATDGCVKCTEFITNT